MNVFADRDVLFESETLDIPVETTVVEAIEVEPVPNNESLWDFITRIGMQLANIEYEGNLAKYEKNLEEYNKDQELYLKKSEEVILYNQKKSEHDKELDNYRNKLNKLRDNRNSALIWSFWVSTKYKINKDYKKNVLKLGDPPEFTLRHEKDLQVPNKPKSPNEPKKPSDILTSLRNHYDGGDWYNVGGTQTDIPFGHYKDQIRITSSLGSNCCEWCRRPFIIVPGLVPVDDKCNIYIDCHFKISGQCRKPIHLCTKCTINYSEDMQKSGTKFPSTSNVQSAIIDKLPTLATIYP